MINQKQKYYFLLLIKNSNFVFKQIRDLGFEIVEKSLHLKLKCFPNLESQKNGSDNNR